MPLTCMHPEIYIEREASNVKSVPRRFLLPSGVRKHPYSKEVRSRLHEHHISSAALLESPLVFPSHFLFFFGCEIVLDVKRLPDLFWTLPFDHIGHGHARQIQQAFDVEVVGRQNEVEERPLIYLHERRVPGFHGFVVWSRFVFLRFLRVHVVRTVFDHFRQDLAGYVGQRNLLLDSGVCSVRSRHVSIPVVVVVFDVDASSTGLRSVAFSPHLSSLSFAMLVNTCAPSIMFLMVTDSNATSSSTSNSS